LWPIHPKPLSDELLSSWMIRIARTYGLTPASFWNCQAGSIHFRKVDYQADDRLLNFISVGTATRLDRVVATTLRGLNSFGIDRHGGHQDGIRFCPACLDESPYFRRRWRLEFFMLCDVHEFALHDHCPNCRGLVRLEQVPLGSDSIAVCDSCGFDLRRAPAIALASKVQTRAVLQLETRLLRVLDASPTAGAST
jgi:hypothetical protein